MSVFNNNFSLALVLFNSIKYYRTNKVDDKSKRSLKDILSAKIINKNNFEYDRSTKTWKQTSQSSKLVIEVRSNPKSYPTTDTINIHKYPITFEFKDIKLRANTPFKWREGGLKKPIFKIPGGNSTDVANINIRNGTQLQFFYEMEWVAKINGLLWGICRAKGFPKKTNPKGFIYFGKHALYCVEKIIIPFLESDKLEKGVIRNE